MFTSTTIFDLQGTLDLSSSHDFVHQALPLSECNIETWEGLGDKATVCLLHGYDNVMRLWVTYGVCVTMYTLVLQVH